VLSSEVPSGPRARPVRRAEIAQLVEHATENRGVASSILALGTNKPGARSSRAEVAQLVEHHLAKVRVAGSSPVFRSIFLPSPPSVGAVAPSSSGRTADFGSVYRGSNPRGAASSVAALGGSLWQNPAAPRRRGEVAQHGGLQNLYSAVRIRSSPPQLQPANGGRSRPGARGEGEHEALGSGMPDDGRRRPAVTVARAVTIALAGVAEGQTRPT
jgi:hypothetical protein